MTLIVLPPVRLKPIGAPRAVGTTRIGLDVGVRLDDAGPGDGDRLALRRIEREHRERERQVLVIGRDGEGADGPCGPTDDAAEDRRALRFDLDLDEAREPGVPAVDRRDVDVDDLVGGRVVEPVVEGELTRGGLGVGRIGSARTGRRERGRVGGVLLVAAFDEHHPDVEREGRHQQQAR